MAQHYECELKTDGFRIRVTVVAEKRFEVESLARQKAAERLEQVYRLKRRASDFNVISIVEKSIS